MNLTIDLPVDQFDVLNAKARDEGLSIEKFGAQLLQQALVSSLARQPYYARIREIWADMPDGVRAKLPPDGASEHDHYIYGLPKKQP